MSQKRYSDDEIADVVADAKSYKQAQERLTGSGSAASYTHFVRRVKKMKLDTSHFDPYWFAKTNESIAFKTKYTPQSLLVLNEELTDRVAANILRRCMLDFGFIYECKLCHLFAWQGKDIRLEIDHINGNWRDNRSENLRFLCPNCHSQCDTNYKVTAEQKEKEKERVEKRIVRIAKAKSRRTCECGKPKNRDAKKCVSCWEQSRNRIEWPSHSELSRMVKETNYSAVGKILGVSDNAVRKRLRTH